MILTCNSCGKKFVVPDNAITVSGRLVQCGSCGNKWKQFPVGEKKSKKISRSQKSFKTSASSTKKYRNRKNQKKLKKKQREISLYSPEYLAKKHGIKIKRCKY